MKMLRIVFDENKGLYIPDPKSCSCTNNDTSSHGNNSTVTKYVSKRIDDFENQQDFNDPSSSLGFNPPKASTPKASTPKGKSQSILQYDLINAPHFPQLKNVNFDSLNIANSTLNEMSDLYVKSAKFLKIIVTAQQQGTRKTIGD